VLRRGRSCLPDRAIGFPTLREQTRPRRADKGETSSIATEKHHRARVQAALVATFNLLNLRYRDREVVTHLGGHPA
jgi:hypothetical protein